ncbi:hypothetical protein SI65_10157 [Aspergillus cristatus]|uniref:Glucose-methanol-choline oxidoreductase N-terminal domain-containing protein n=1 Tax=Aspergillus cristatus TaxID=573508 RepID=A0A1E3B0H4_ASPCR|nr:hypothetical protein SI65_10157 [Aspergillus cristatus]
MRLSQFSLLGLLAIASAQEELNLWNYGATGNILGNTFDIPGTNATFDYNKSVSVAVVEAGGFYEIDNGNYSVVPGYSSQFTGSKPNAYNPLIDWGFSTESQQALGGRKLHYARGKTLGGCSARNFMLYHRPTVDSMQRWADEVDDQSYAFDNLLPYYKKSYAFSSSGGPLEVSFSNAVDAFGTWARKAFITVGMGQINGLNSGRLLGSAYATFTINPKNTHRSTSESSFLKQSLNNGSGLVVYKNTLAQKILFNSNKTATGVQVATGGTFGTPPINFTLNARNEVILSAGALQSPQLLMVSGIGFCDHLSKRRPEHARPPGLRDRAPRVNVLTNSASANNKTLAAENANKYLHHATGPLSIFGPGYYGWEKLPDPYRSKLSNASVTALANFPPDWPELEYLPVAAFNGDNQVKQPADPLDGHNYATLNIALVAPLSRGTVSLSGPDMTTPPLVDPNWLSHPADMDLAVQSFKRTREIWSVLSKMGIADLVEYYPGANVTSDAQIREFVKESIRPVFHAACTCKMGKKGDGMAVVDSSARVYGVQGVRVVDASSFPLLPPGHPQSTVYALAEKIADDILGLTLW